MPRQKLGQHFLSSPAWRERIARTLPADVNTTWLEIGPGHGEMTELLAQHARRVIAIETDSTLAASLRQRAAAEWPNVEVVEADILSVDLAQIISKSLSADLHQGTAFYPDEGRAAVPKAGVERGPSGPEASLVSLESARVRKGTALAVTKSGPPEAPLGAEDSCKPPEPIDLRKGTVSTVPQGDPTSRPLGPEASSAAPDAHESVATGSVGRGLPAQAGFNRDKKARPNSGALAPEAHTENDPRATTKNRFRVYGNLPYYITSPILSYLFRFTAQIDSIHIVIQYEVAARIVATPGHREYAYLSALCQYFARPEILLRIPPGAFRPPPKVNSALVAMNLPGERARLGIRDDAAFLKFLQNCFSQKRKTLRNNLKNVFSDAQIAAALAACKLTPKSRAEEISLAQFAELYRQLAPEE